MSRPLTPSILAAALAAASFPLSPPASAAASADAPVSALPRAAPEPLPRWGRPPEAVRNAHAVLRDACAAWPKLVPLGSEPPSALLAQADQQYVSSCNLVLDPEGTGQLSLLQGGALGAAAAGIAAVAFKLAKFLVFGLSGAAGRGFTALWNRRRRRLDGWPE
jgi:hypothetical protein